MKKKLPMIATVVLFFVGVVILLYPTFSEYYNAQRSSKAVSYYTHEVESLTEIENAQMMESAKEYNNKLHLEDMKFIDGAVEDEVYGNEMDIVNGMMGYININKIDVLLPIYHGTSEATLSIGVGHIEGSSLPTGESGNHTVLTGHTGLPSAQLFTQINQLEVGDTFELLILNDTFVYKVVETHVVLPHEVSTLKPVAGKDLVTLVTCTPYGINSHRLLVEAEQIEVDEEIKQSIEIQIEENIVANKVNLRVDYIVLVILLLLLTSIFAVNCVWIYKLQRQGRKG